MATVAELSNFVYELAPLEMKMEWDNAGLLCGHAEHKVKKVMVALDPFIEVCEEAFQSNADVIVTHHPLIFHAIKSVSDMDEVGKSVLYLAEHGIAAINAHTNLDQAPDGVNECLAEKLNLKNVHVIHAQGTDRFGRPWGLLRLGEISPVPMEDFAIKVKKALGCNTLKCISAQKLCQYIAVGGGACGSELTDVYQSGADTFVTADVKYNQYQTAYELGINLIDAGHFETEWPIVRYLADKIKCRFPDIEVIISQKNVDHVRFI